MERVYKCAFVGLFYYYITSYPLYGRIYLFTAIGFRPDGSGQYTCTEIGKRQHKRRNKRQNNKKHRIYNREHKNTKQET